MDDSIIADLQESYGITFNDITPVTGGLLNKKWKISTQNCEFLVKQYSPKRFRRDQIEKIEAALERQIILEKNGVQCPFLWQCEDRVIRWIDDKIAYMVMDFKRGETVNSETITLTQMYSLGSACAIMRKAFSNLPIPSAESLPTFGGYTMDSLWGYFNSRIMKISSENNDEYQKALLWLEPIVKQLDNSFFDKLPKGFAHEDFQIGNILFNVDSVSAVVDFDRNCFSYIWHDIGRAILSFALEGNILNTQKVKAFLEGYSQHFPLNLSNIADALRLTWCIETPWWIQPQFFEECGEIPKRFKDEMLWLTKHWSEIDCLVGS